MADKKVLKIKCSVCGQEGHNKRTCPTAKSEVKPEVKPEVKSDLQIIYVLEVAEDNGDSVHRNTTLCASIDGLMKRIGEIMDELQKFHGDDECEENDDDEYTEIYKKDLLYYKDTDVFNDVPRPTKEYLESVFNNPKRSHLDGLIVKVGKELGGAPCFACEISVHKKVLHP